MTTQVAIQLISSFVTGVTSAAVDHPGDEIASAEYQAALLDVFADRRNRFEAFKEALAELSLTGEAGALVTALAADVAQRLEGLEAHIAATVEDGAAPPASQLWFCCADQPDRVLIWVFDQTRGKLEAA